MSTNFLSRPFAQMRSLFALSRPGFSGSSRRFALLSSLALVGVCSLGSASGQAGEELSGTYVLMQQSATKTNLVVAKVINKTRLVSLHQLTHAGGRLSGVGKTCSMKMQSDSKIAKTTIPPAFIRAMPTVQLDGKVEKTAEGYSFHQGATAVVIGSKLKNPKTEELPSKKDDPRVIDHDGDGNPGVTVNVSGMVDGDLYFTQRTVSELKGKSVENGFRGELVFTSDLETLDATSFMLKSSAKAKPILSQSYFKFVRVADDASCSDAIRTAASL